jgi:hypothetical protein
MVILKNKQKDKKLSLSQAFKVYSLLPLADSNYGTQKKTIKRTDRTNSFLPPILSAQSLGFGGQRDRASLDGLQIKHPARI